MNGLGEFHTQQSGGPMKPHRANLVRMKCPHCEQPAVTRTSKTLTSLLREIYYQCTNMFCGASFMANLEIVRAIIPSQTPNPEVRLPMLAAASHRATANALPDALQPAANDIAEPEQAQPATG